MAARRWRRVAVVLAWVFWKKAQLGLRTPRVDVSFSDLPEAQVRMGLSLLSAVLPNWLCTVPCTAACLPNCRLLSCLFAGPDVNSALALEKECMQRVATAPKASF